MTEALLLFEDGGWRRLRPLTDVLPVSALAFGASDLARRWLAATGLPLAGLAGRARPRAAWSEAPAIAARPQPADLVLVANAAVLPERWLEGALGSAEPARFDVEDRVAAVLAPFGTVARVLEAEEPEELLRGLDLPVRRIEGHVLAYPWHLIAWNAEAIAADLEGMEPAIEGEVHPAAVLLDPARIRIEAGTRVDALAVLDARGGPIRIGRGAVVLPQTVVVGPCVVGDGTQLLSGVVSRTTLGPECRVAGEVEECVFQGYGNKRHHGFLGHSFVSEWVNLGALTTTSDLKNNYGPVRVWIDGLEVDSGSPKVGSILGAHVKTGIGTLLPTGAVVGVGANLFGGGRFAPKQVPAFAWWDGSRTDEHRLEPFLATARVVLSRRGRRLERAGEELLRDVFRATAAERDPQRVVSPSTTLAASSSPRGS